MVRLIRRGVLLAYSALPLLPLMAFFALSLFLTIPAHARERTIIVDEKNPPKTRRIKPSGNTKVITIRSEKPAGKAPSIDGDICPALGGYYCKSVGKEAWLREAGLYLGRISGVAWRDKGQPMGLYLGALEVEASDKPPEDAPAKPLLLELLRKNTLSMSDTFYFIISVEGLEGPVLVEPHRIETGE
jgi:hypothetical protein